MCWYMLLSTLMVNGLGICFVVFTVALIGFIEFMGFNLHNIAARSVTALFQDRDKNIDIFWNSSVDFLICCISKKFFYRWRELLM